MERFVFVPVVEELKFYYKHYDENGEFLKSGSFSMDSGEVNLYDNYYFDVGVYKVVDDKKIPVSFCYLIDLHTLSSGSTFDYVVKLDSEFVYVFNGSDVVFKKPLLFYFKNDVFNINTSFKNGDDNVELSLKVDLLNNMFEVYFSVNGLYVPFSFDIEKFVSSDLFYENKVFSYLSSIEADIENVSKKLDNLKVGVDLSPIEADIENVSKKLDNLKVGVDLSSVEDSLSDISKKIDVLNVLDISNKIDEKLSQVFNLKSLNGSNGSKFKDGSDTTVKGYSGTWVVKGSYPMLNSDGVTIIVYKLMQDDRLLLAPAPFVGV